MAPFFITGALGFLGQHITQAIQADFSGDEVRILARSARAAFVPLDFERIRRVDGDLNRPETFCPALEGVETVIHNAAMVSFRKADADAVYQANVIGTRQVAQAAQAAGCKNFMFISSISAMGDAVDGLTDESMYPKREYKRQHDMYGYSKLISEQELQEMGGPMRVVILNPSVILGPGSDRIIAVLRATRLLPWVPMFSFINSFVDARDVARAVSLAVEHGRHAERYIVTAHNVDMLDFTRAALRLAHSRARVVALTRQWAAPLDGLVGLLDALRLNPGLRQVSDMTRNKQYSNQKIQREMGWQPTFSLEQSIQDSLPAKS